MGGRAALAGLRSPSSYAASDVAAVSAVTAPMTTAGPDSMKSNAFSSTHAASRDVDSSMPVLSSQIVIELATPSPASTT